MQNIFLTGASGYVGSTLMTDIPKDWNVTCLMREWVRTNMFHGRKNVKVCKGDLSEHPNNTLQIPEDTDTVIHLAGIKEDFPFESSDYGPIFKTNVVGTHRLIEAAKHVGVKRFVFASTYKVYHRSLDPIAVGWAEDDDLAPDGYYGLSKVVSENELIASGLNYQILRFANVFGYGSGIRLDDVVHTFILSALTKGKIEVYGDGMQTIDLIDVGDVCKVLRAIVGTKMPRSQTYNIGSGMNIRIVELAERIKDMVKTKTGKNIEIVMVSQPNATTTNRRISVSKFRRTFSPYMELTPYGESFERYIEIMNDMGGGV